MILQAHVGVGILGKEGQQAARSADFAIGQFKFLKPLMFVHGREAYRRNSLLILYTFYKNVLYVTTQFFFGFYSAFSGQPLYEPFIYQMYNITFTGIPIMFFALFDFEYEKDAGPLGAPSKGKFYYMRDPHLYRIGIENACFGIGHFLRWVLYGLGHAALVYLFNFYALLVPG
jgi:phospholipid-transporting ATPase